MEHVAVHVAIAGPSEAWEPVSEGLQASPDVELVVGSHDDTRVDVIFYDVSAPEQLLIGSDVEANCDYWTVGVDLDTRRVIELSGSETAPVTVDGLAAAIRASGFVLRPVGREF